MYELTVGREYLYERTELGALVIKPTACHMCAFNRYSVSNDPQEICSRLK